MIKPVVLVSTAGFIRLFGFNESRAFLAEGAGRGKAVFDEDLYGYFVIWGCLRFNGGYLGAGERIAAKPADRLGRIAAAAEFLTDAIAYLDAAVRAEPLEIRVADLNSVLGAYAP